MSILPLRGKRPTLSEWEPYQTQRANPAEIESWIRGGNLQNLGIVCGRISRNLVVVDLDQLAGYETFIKQFPYLSNTYTVLTGSGHGFHLYFYSAHLPDSMLAKNTRIGNLELRANGMYVVAPPSIHDRTGNPYTIFRPVPILRVNSLIHVAAWMDSEDRLTPKPDKADVPTRLASRPEQGLRRYQEQEPKQRFVANPQVIQAIADTLLLRGYRLEADGWLNGPCIYPHLHRHQDSHVSFGFNIDLGYGKCHAGCDIILTKDICAALHIDPATYGGLRDKRAQTQPEDSKYALST